MEGCDVIPDIPSVSEETIGQFFAERKIFLGRLRELTVDSDIDNICSSSSTG